jgi:hypothetical protein
MTPSEIRMTFIDLNPDEALDKLSETTDNRPGKPAAKNRQQPEPDDNAGPQPAARSRVDEVAARHARQRGALPATRAGRRREAREEARQRRRGLAAALRDFYADHATFVANTMRISMTGGARAG